MLFRSLSRRQFGLFPEAAAVLRRLRERYAVGLVSDAQWVFTEPELAITGLRDLFEVRVLSSRCGYKKPDPRLFARALAALHVAPEHARLRRRQPRAGPGRRAARGDALHPLPADGATAPASGPTAAISRHAELEAAVAALLPPG